MTDFNAEVEDAHEIMVLDSRTAIEAVDRAAIDVQITTAKMYPRDVTAFKRDALTMATLDEETAGSMFYALPRGGKQIEGPSARLAEVVASAWGNLRAETDIVAIDDKHVTAMGSCFDLERNVAVRVRVKRRITDRHGKRFTDDMIVVTGNAAASIALRNAVFKVVPFAFVKPIYMEARKASLGKGTTIEQKRHNALDWFQKIGVDADRLCALFGKKGIEGIGEEELVNLRGLKTAIQEGDTTVEEAFPRPGSGDQTDRVDDLKERLKAKAEKGAEPPVETDEDKQTEAALRLSNIAMQAGISPTELSQILHECGNDTAEAMSRVKVRLQEKLEGKK